MANIGVLIEIEGGELKSTNFGVLTAASEQGKNDVYAIVMSGAADAVKDELAAYGAGKIVAAAGEGIEKSPDLQAAVLAAAIREYSLAGVLGLASARGRDIFARLAAAVNLPLAADCVAVNFAEKTVRKSHFSGKTVATIRLNADVLLAAIRPNAVEPVKTPVTAEILNFAPSVPDPGRVRIVETKLAGTDRMDLTEAAIIITGGRPIGSAENYKILEECASALGSAAVGASRAAVDAGFAPHSKQVGQTGKTVSPKLYIGCGLSGSVQHFAGMKTSKVIVAINTDKDAPIFEKCDYGIIGDLFEIVPELTRALKEK
ncbi:electron transfer flavoprotein subunit alpha/FixB family protein [Desulfococcus sp.]|uniref:electron transfer flavoprotein subunit alpha/FixB family protein n=1 Tax=Desulfococcus sp. TaxID=2025834 RepID=UPI0035933146